MYLALLVVFRTRTVLHPCMQVLMIYIIVGGNSNLLSVCMEYDIGVYSRVIYMRNQSFR